LRRTTREAMNHLKLSASILNADFGNLADQVRQVEAAGVDYIHVDVMDGHFVPNLTFGFVILDAIRQSTELPLDVHLMIDQPERYVREFVSTGANCLTVHQEATAHLHKVVADIKSLGLRAGAAICPATPLSTVEEICADLDLLLVMTINPGFGGQALIPATIEKVARARKLLDLQGSAAALQVDGGVKTHNVVELVRAGADNLVIGTGIFEAPGGIASGVADVRQILRSAGMLKDEERVGP
jgi:ribulose-phosphate 3-epimerase